MIRKWLSSHRSLVASVTSGTIIAMQSFGASAPLKDLMKHFGFTLENVLKAAR